MEHHQILQIPQREDLRCGFWPIHLSFSKLVNERCEMRKDGYIRLALPIPKNELEKQALAWLSGEKYLSRADERMAKVVIAYQLWLEDQQRHYQKVSGE